MQLIDTNRASAIMKRHGLDIIIAHTRTHRGYIADYWHYLPILEDTQVVWCSPPIPLPTYVAFAGLPADKRKGAFLLHREGVEQKAVLPSGIWIEDLRFRKNDQVET